MATEKSNLLLNPEATAAVASAGAGFTNDAFDKIKKARAEGPFDFRVLGFIGGLAMIASNSIAVLDRFFSFNFTGAMIAVYGIIFGCIIAALDAPGPCSKRARSTIAYYAKFLEYVWGRGALYFFVGSLQVANWNMLDWAVGGFMMFTGVTAMGVGISAARNLKLLKFSLKDERMLKSKWNKSDADNNGLLDVKELTAFSSDAGVDMSRNEIAAVFLSLDKNFDDKISYEEFYAWWLAAGTYGADQSLSV